MNTKINRFIIFLLAMVFIMVFAVAGLNDFVRESIHNERVTYLTEQSRTVADLIEITLDQYLSYAKSSAQTIGYTLSDGDDIHDYMNRIEDILNFKNARLILVDSLCTWYGENNTSGKITVMEDYTSDSPEEMIYITTGVDVDIESFCFRIRLDRPVTVKSGNNDLEITYCNLILYFDIFNEIIKNAFPYEGNSFIVDEDGLMLYKNFRMGTLIGGSNLFAKYERAEFLYGDTGESLLADVKADKISVAEMKIDGTNYFICTAPINTNGWKVSFVIPAAELATGSYINSILAYIITIAVVFVIAVSATGLISIKVATGRSLLEKQQKANALLAKASSAKSDFISNMSHDIRTPINGIMGMTKLAMTQDNPAKTNDCLKKISTSSKYLLDLVNDVLDMSTIESGNLKIVHEELELKEFGESCIDIIKGQAEGRHLSFVCDFENIKHNLVLSDERHLRQVIINILSNSVKFTPGKGTISFSINELEYYEDKAQGLYEFLLSDTGVGMSPEFLEHIWERFKQDDAGAKSEFKGTGLGMAITKSIVDTMDGNISIESEPGRGSSFSVKLLLDTAAPKKAAEEERLDGIKILLAEDNEINAEIACELLSDFGAEITRAENGRIALEKFSESPEGFFNVILMDIMMPEMNGNEACRAIRALTRSDSASVPIIAMTANTTKEDMETSLSAGMNAHVNKPLDFNMLVKTINSYCGEG